LFKNRRELRSFCPGKWRLQTRPALLHGRKRKVERVNEKVNIVDSWALISLSLPHVCFRGNLNSEIKMKSN
jgi:hypothetical protein